MELFKTHPTLLNEGTENQKRSEILEYFQLTYDVYEKLFDVLAHDEAFTLRADPLRHPLIFYYGHTATFFINKLILAKIIDQRIDPEFESIFAVGVDEMSWDDLDERHYHWPAVAEVKAYRDQVRERVETLIETMPLTVPIRWNDPFWAILMGIEHERIHLETSSVLIRQLPIEQVRKDKLWSICPWSGLPPKNELLDVAGGDIVLGKDREHRFYGWDNEYGRQESHVGDFKASKYLVSNEEYLEFVTAGGYHLKEYWTEEGWAWKTYRQVTCPIFWIPDDGQWRFRTMVEEIDMPWDWPVEVNYLESKAFCNWKAEQTGQPIRLPTEAQWYRLGEVAGVPDSPPWEKGPGNINLAHYASSCPITEFSFGDFYDVLGNVWQWTETPINGFPGFEVHPWYDDFSTPTFDGKHNLIKGGSWISTGNEATRESRYAFRRHFFQHAGFRYVASDEPIVIESGHYEVDSLVSQYCEFHYGPEYFDVANFQKIIARTCVDFMAGRGSGRAMDLGCGVGRSTLELARHFDHVTGLDVSARFIKIAVALQEQGYTRYQFPEEGELVSYHEKHLKDFGLEAFSSKVAFFQSDACNLKAIYTGYDLILAANLIDRVYSPRKFLSTIHARLNPQGLLVLASPYTLSTEYIERDQWIGGYRKDGEPYTVLEGITDILSEHFNLLCKPFDIPFVIRESRRKYQHNLSQVTVWEKKG
ncbi:MAG: 5-histidylcysteine sulfoxide synthase [Phycisphaerae bacterium]|nr:5-histidylcysteine sulfoxide synthase [Phycisphaerae bacterium]